MSHHLWQCQYGLGVRGGNIGAGAPGSTLLSVVLEFSTYMQ